jgi:hypothetical protein
MAFNHLRKDVYSICRRIYTVQHSRSNTNKGDEQGREFNPVQNYGNFENQTHQEYLLKPFQRKIGNSFKVLYSTTVEALKV